MDVDALIGMLAAAVTLSVAATSAVFGIVRALPWFIGVCCGTSTIVLLVGSGVTGLILAVPGLAPVLVVLAGAYILYLAYRIAFAPVLKSADEAGPPPKGIAGYLFALANPKGYAAIGAVFAGFVLIARAPAYDAVVKAAILIAMVFVVNVTWLLTGAALSKIFQSARAGRIMNMFFAALLVLSVVLLIL